MKVILGTYRGPEFVHRALASLDAKMEGLTDLVIVDDSGNPEWAEHYKKLGRVIALPSVGYTFAMQEVCAEAGRDRFLFWEEDFVLTEPTHVRQLTDILDINPTLAQVALLRGPHFPIEHKHGGLLPALEARLGKSTVNLRQHGSASPSSGPQYLSQRGTFTCNPSIWQDGIAAFGWPSGAYSEDRMRDRLLRRGYRFGYLPGIRVEHDGVRSGHGY